MAIPKTIYQTYKTADLPLLTRWYVSRMKSRNPAYDYQFYDDVRIDQFIHQEYGAEIYQLYKKINIGAAKADFFRYAILYKKGGIYLDVDSLLLNKLDDFISESDHAIISFENNKEKKEEIYIQWALAFEAGHPFLKKTMELVIDNLKNNRYPNDVHKMTGPTAFTQAIQNCLLEKPEIAYRQMGFDYDRNFKFHYSMSKFFFYGVSRQNHWKTEQLTKSVLKG